MLELGLELGKAGTHGAGRGVHPVLADGAGVATLQASNWKEKAVALVGDVSWTFTKQERRLQARWTVDPEGSARMSARQTSVWRGTWHAELEGTPVEVSTTSVWKGTHRYAVAGRTVAESGTTGWASRPTLAVGRELPLHQQVFLLWVELIRSRRAAASVTVVT